MLTRRKMWFFLSMLLCASVAGFLWREPVIRQWISDFRGAPPASTESPPPEKKAPSEAAAEKKPNAARSAETASEASNPLPPSPPLPGVSPEAGQAERREAFQLRESVDYIVMRDEPFDAQGRKLTVGEMLGAAPGESLPGEGLPSVQEKEIGAMVRRSIRSSVAPASSRQPAYYGVKIVKKTENVWDIHYSVLREYFARRQVLLSPGSDKPSLDGRSSGIGRILKFIEGVVHVYSTDGNRLVKDINLVQPDSCIIFFKVSELFLALDALRPEDLGSIRFVSNYLRLERDHDKRDLLEHGALLE